MDQVLDMIGPNDGLILYAIFGIQMLTVSLGFLMLLCSCSSA